MSKKTVTGEDGKTYTVKEKKPWYKRFWVWLLIIVVIIVGASAMGGGDDNGGTKVNSTSSSKKETPKFYKLGDTVKVGDITYTLNSVETTSERNEFEDSKPKNVIVVKYHVKNNSEDELPVGADLDVYDSSNDKADSYPVDGETMDAVAAGKEMDVTQGFGVKKLGKVELQFSPLVSTEKAAKFQVEVK